MILLQPKEILNKYEGKWKSTQNIYLFNNKNILIKHQNLSFDLYNKKKQNIYTISYPLSKPIVEKYYLIANQCLCQQKVSNEIFYEILISNKSYFKIHKTVDNTKYSEILYDISSNFKVAISYLKIKNSYKAIIFSSYIKKI